MQKERKRIKSAATRQTSKRIAEEALLKHKVPKRVSTIMNRYPDIGEKMEVFVRNHRVGADQWRRTGVFTFTSNKNTKGSKVTYKKLQEHLQKRIQHVNIIWYCS